MKKTLEHLKKKKQSEREKKITKLWHAKSKAFTEVVKRAMRIKGVKENQLKQDLGLKGKDLLWGKHNFKLDEITSIVNYFPGILYFEYGKGIPGDAVIKIKIKEN